MKLTNKYTRRRFLRNASGAALALPWLEATSGMAFGQTSTDFPSRLLVFAHHQGTLTDRFFPRQTGTDFELPELLRPLAAYRDQMLVLSNVDNVVRSQINSGNGHTTAGRSMFTANVFSQLVDAQGRLNEVGGVNNGPSAGPSFDHAVAQLAQGDAPHLRLDFQTRPHVGEYDIFWAGRDQPISALFDPYKMAGLLSDQTDDQARPISPLRPHRRLVLEGIASQERMLRAQLSSADKQRLDMYLERVEGLEQTLEDIPTKDCRSLDLSFLPSGYSIYNAELENLTARAMAQTIALSFACDLTRVSTFHFTNYHAPTFPWLNTRIPEPGFGNWHDMIHKSGAPDVRNLLARGFLWYSEMIAETLDLLASMPEGNGSVLDNTLVLWMSEFDSGAGLHRTTNLPILLIGNVKGQLNTGRHLALPGRTTNELFMTLINLFGGNAQSFGLSHGRDGQPLVRSMINELLS